MSNNRKKIKECRESMDDYKWMMEEAIARGDKDEIQSLRKSMKRAKNELLAMKQKGRKEKRYNDLYNSDAIALAMCAF